MEFLFTKIGKGTNTSTNHDLVAREKETKSSYISRVRRRTKEKERND